MAKSNRGVVSSLRSLLSFGEESEAGKDATTLLHEDHDRVDALFSRFEAATGNAEKRDIARKTIAELRVHAQLEEQLFYPSLASELEDDEMVKCAIEEHGLMKHLLDDLDRMRPNDGSFDAKYKVLTEIVRHHVREEESQVFPAAQSSDLDLDALGLELLELKRSLISGKRVSRKSGGRRSAARKRSRTTGRTTAAKRRATAAARRAKKTAAKARGGAKKKASSRKKAASRRR